MTSLLWSSVCFSFAQQQLGPDAQVFYWILKNGLVVWVRMKGVLSLGDDVSFEPAIIYAVKFFLLRDDSMSNSACCWVICDFPEDVLKSVSLTFGIHEGGLIEK